MIEDAAFAELFPWAQGFRTRLRLAQRPPLDGRTLYVTSDYSGTDPGSRYEVYSFLVTCPEDTVTWRVLRDSVRRAHLSDGRRMSFKSLGDRRRAAALPGFLEAASALPGICVTVAISKSIANLCHGDMFLSRDSPLLLRHSWTAKALERMVRATHFAALIIDAYSRPQQNVYWISDEDELFGSAARSEDLVAMLGMWTGMHLRHPLGELGAGTTAIDEGDRIEEDLAAIPDLMAGATREYINAVSRAAGGRIRIGLAANLPNALSHKTDTILTWAFDVSALTHVTLLFDRGPTGGFFLSRIDLG